MASYSQAEALTRQFYRWEQRGRGWSTWDTPVELEPPFVPFFFRASTPERIDDGRKHTFLSGLVETLKGSGAPSSIAHDESDSEEAQLRIEPTPFNDGSPLCEIGVAMAPDERVTIDQAERFLLALSLCHYPISFEVLGKGGQICFQFVCRERDLTTVEGVLRSYFPAASLKRQTSATQMQLNWERTLIVDFGLSEEFMRPLRSAGSLDPDPLVGFVGVLEGLDHDEFGILQVMFQGTQFPWTESILRSVSDGAGGSFFADASDMLQLAYDKTRQPLFATVVRVAGSGRTSERAWDIVRGMAGAFVQFSDPQSNELIPLTNDGYDQIDHIRDVQQRMSHRSGMLLNSRELLSIVHPPSSSVRSPNVLRYFKKTRPVPPSVRSNSYVLGENIHRGTTSTVSLSVRQRLNHVHVIGATGMGKSTLLHGLIVQDIEQGYGVSVIDPHGDLIEKVLSYVPRKRLKDVILFDPSDAENPHGLNILSVKGEAEKNVATSDLVAVFRRMSTSWGDQMTVVLGNGIQAFLESDRGGTLSDLRKFFIDESFRKEFLKTVHDPEVRYFWEKEHHLLRGNTIGSLLTRLDTFLRPKVIRQVIAPRKDLHTTDIINHGKILLVKLAQGLIGEENSTLLGTLIVSKLHQAAMARQSIAAEKRTPFFLYIDEFQNFITPSLAGVLSGTRKYGLGLVLANQELRQIFNQDTGVANSVISNPGTRICFRLGDFDSQKLQDGFTHFSASDLQNLGVGEAVCRVERSNDDFNLNVVPQPPVNVETAKTRRKRLIELSHGLSQSTKTHIIHQSEDTESQLDDEAIAPAPLRNPLAEPPPLEQKEKPVLVSSLAEPYRKTDDKELSQHRYLQTLIRRMAEDRGYRAVIEEPVPDKSGRVDVGLERDGVRIACEIALTTTDEHETGNIEKCLKAGYDQVLVVAIDKRRLDKIRASASQKLDGHSQSKVHFFEPQELFAYLERRAVDSNAKEERIKGYRVKVEYQDVGVAEGQNKRDAVAHVILQSIKRMKEK